MKKILFIVLIAFVLSSSSLLESSIVDSPLLDKINSIIETMPNEDIKILCKKVVNKLADITIFIIKLIRIIGCEKAKPECIKVFGEEQCNEVINAFCH